jgi:hypothetical protein
VQKQMYLQDKWNFAASQYYSSLSLLSETQIRSNNSACLFKSFS